MCPVRAWRHKRPSEVRQMIDGGKMGDQALGKWSRGVDSRLLLGLLKVGVKQEIIPDFDPLPSASSTLINASIMAIQE